MGDFLLDIIDENFVLLNRNDFSYGNCKGNLDYKIAIENSIRIFFFIKELDSNFGRKAKLDQEESAKLNESLDFLRKFSFYYSKKFIRKLLALLYRLYSKIANSSSKKKIYQILKNIEHTNLVLIPISKNLVLTKNFRFIKQRESILPLY